MDPQGLQRHAAQHRLASASVRQAEVIHVVDLAGNGANTERFRDAGHGGFGDAGGAFRDLATLDAFLGARADEDHIAIRSRGGQHALHPIVDSDRCHD